MIATSLSDKEVGELWRKAIAEHPLGFGDWQLWMQSLIRKLVAEAVRAEFGTTNWARELAILKRFGIDPEEW